VAGDTSGTFPGEPAGNGQDIFVGRFDKQSGQPLWVRQFGIRGGVTGFGLGGIGTDDTGLYVAGSTYLGQSRGAFLRKYDFDGQLLWAHEFLGTLGCSGNFQGLATHGTNVYVIGQWFDNYFEDPATCSSGASHVVGVVLKYDSAGNLLWRRRLQGEGEGAGYAAFTGAHAVWAAETGVYVGGNLTTTFPGHVADGPRSDRSECPGVIGNQFRDKLDAYVRRYDFDGNVIWTRQFGSNVFDFVSGIGSSATSVYVAGITSCRIDDQAALTGALDEAFVLGIAIDPTSLPGQVQLIVGRLETLNDAGRLGPGVFGSLVMHLEAALVELDQAGIPAAEHSLEAFIAEVRTLEASGTLSSDEAAALVGAANGVIGLL
jgi:hypothetical protein